MIEILLTILLGIVVFIAALFAVAFVVGLFRAVLLARKVRKTQKEVTEALDSGNPIGALNDLFKGLG